MVLWFGVQAKPGDEGLGPNTGSQRMSEGVDIFLAEPFRWKVGRAEAGWAGLFVTEVRISQEELKGMVTLGGRHAERVLCEPLGTSILCHFYTCLS